MRRLKKSVKQGIKKAKAITLLLINFIVILKCVQNPYICMGLYILNTCVFMDIMEIEGDEKNVY